MSGGERRRQEEEQQLQEVLGPASAAAADDVTAQCFLRCCPSGGQRAAEGARALQRALANLWGHQGF